MAALTNVLGFGSLALSNYPGLRSVGIISAVGSVACLLTALMLLPALLYAWGARNGKVGVVRVAAVLGVLGIVLNRLNVSLIAYNWNLSQRYWPSCVARLRQRLNDKPLKMSLVSCHALAAS